MSEVVNFFPFLNFQTFSVEERALSANTFVFLVAFNKEKSCDDKTATKFDVLWKHSAQVIAFWLFLLNVSNILMYVP